jgi:hypothetical protein
LPLLITIIYIKILTFAIFIFFFMEKNDTELDASKLHPAFSGLFFQQRRTYTTMSQQQQQQQQQQQPHQQPPPIPPHRAGLNTPGLPSIQSPPPGTVGLRDARLQQGAPILNHFEALSGGGGGVGGGSPPSTMMMDPARTSPIFYGYSSKPDKPKM